jgi:hypothetical protein
MWRCVHGSGERFTEVRRLGERGERARSEAVERADIDA